MELKMKKELALAVQSLSSSFKLVQHGTTTFAPVHWETEEMYTDALTPEETIWIPLTTEDKRRLANDVSGILFATDAELRSFIYMLNQYAADDTSKARRILIRTEAGLRVLNEDGALAVPTGEFIPNFIRPMLNENAADKQEMFDILANSWLDSEEEAHSLLHHLATALAPGWSAVKYVLLLGDGRNGKSVLLTMLSDLFGYENVSNITRQQMAEQLPVCVELNNRLINIVFDGRMEYIKDSGLEKTLIAGEPGHIRLLYESNTTRVQTNGLFIEALNKEPKSRDKSSALQKRLVRFRFPNVFPRDIAFEQKMRSPEMIGALLALMVDHYVTQDEVIGKLALSSASMSLQVDQMWLNSPVYQYLEYCVTMDPSSADSWVGATLDAHVAAFMSWRVAENFMEFSSADTVNLFKECFDIDWKTVREGGKPVRKRIIKGLKVETQAFIDRLKEDTNGAQNAGTAVVED